MRIGVVTTSYPREPGDPAGSFVAAHVAAMRALGHDVEVISARDIRSPLFEGSGAPEAFERGFAQRTRAMLAGAVFTAKLTAAIARRITDWDLVIAHWLPCAVAALPTIAATRKPLLAIAHGGDVHTLRRMRLLGSTVRTLEAAGARLAFVSAELRALAGARDAIVQPMGVDVEHFARLGRTPTTPPTLAVIGRLVPIKGVDIAIDAMAHVDTRVQLVIGGEGPEHAALKARTGSDRRFAAQPNAKVNVMFAGQLDPAQRDRLLERASIVVIPSRVLANGRSEGTPLVALEALAAGVPVIASDVGGLRELSGVVRVSPDDPQALAAAIDRVLAAPRSSNELRASVVDLAWPRVAQRLIEIAFAPRSRSGNAF